MQIFYNRRIEVLCWQGKIINTNTKRPPSAADLLMDISLLNWQLCILLYIHSAGTWQFLTLALQNGVTQYDIVALRNNAALRNA
jgi:hypothetical protein